MDRGGFRTSEIGFVHFSVSEIMIFNKKHRFFSSKPGRELFKPGRDDPVFDTATMAGPVCMLTLEDKCAGFWRTRPGFRAGNHVFLIGHLSFGSRKYSNIISDVLGPPQPISEQ